MSAAPDDYYELLGVDATITAHDLRRVWRSLALRWHPDRAGADATLTFQKLAAAYAVLSDPVARAGYDRTRRNATPASGVSSAGRAREERASVPPPVSSNPLRRAPAVMLSRITGPLESLLACGVARRVSSEIIDLYLAHEEARQGGMATIAMNVDIECPACGGPNRESDCMRCSGAGQVQARYSAWLAVPPDAPDGTILKPSVGLPGLLAQPTFRVRIGF